MSAARPGPERARPGTTNASDVTRTNANVILLLTGAIWGMAFVAQATAMETIGPFLFVAARFLLAALVLVPFALWEKRRSVRPVSRGDGLMFVVIGGVLFLGMAFQQVGLLTTTVTNSGFLTGLYVVFAPLVGIAVFREWPHRVVWPAALLALAGIYLLSGGSLGRLTRGDGLTVLCAFMWALQIVLVGRFVKDSGRPFLLSLTQMTVAGVLALSGALAFEAIELAPLVSAWPEIVYTGVVASALAFTLQIIGQRYTTAPQAAIILSSEALFAGLFGALFMGDRMLLGGLVGCGLIFAAMLAVELAPLYAARRRATA